MRQPGCKPGRSADFRTEGSKPTHGKGNRVLHPEPLSEKSGFSSPAKTREGNRVLRTSEEVGLGTRNAPKHLYWVPVAGGRWRIDCRGLIGVRSRHSLLTE